MPDTSSPAVASTPEHRWHAGFWSLIVTQFQNAFNDNALKFLVIYIIVAMNFNDQQRNLLVLAVGALFALPFIFFSMTGGYLADRFSKRSVTIGVKFMEVGVMLFSIASLWLASLPMECAAVFLISTQSALFGPSKYGLLPEILPEERLSWGNGIIELGTFLGSILATMASGILAQRYHGDEEISGVILLGCTMVGLAFSFGITHVPAADPRKHFRWNPLGDFGSQLKLIARERVLAWAVIGNTYLWFLAALLQFVIVIYGHDILHIDDTHISYLQAAVGIGIGLGSVAAGYLSGGKIEYGLIPLGALGMTVFAALLYNPGHTTLSAGIHLALLGFFGGFFAVPLNALIQHLPRPEHKGGVIAAANLLSFVGVFLAAGAYYLFASGFHQTAAAIFLDGAILTLVTTSLSICLLPDSLVRLALWIATHSIYHLHVEARDHVPERGGALLLSSKLSLMDALLLLTSSERAIRFVISRDMYDRPLVKPVATILGAIPFSCDSTGEGFARALETARLKMRAGELVCVSYGGQMNRCAQSQPFLGGLGRVMEGIDAPIISVSVLRGSHGPMAGGRQDKRMTFPEPVSVSFGQAVAASTWALPTQEPVRT